MREKIETAEEVSMAIYLYLNDRLSAEELLKYADAPIYVRKITDDYYEIIVDSPQRKRDLEFTGSIEVFLHKSEIQKIEEKGLYFEIE